MAFRFSIPQVGSTCYVENSYLRNNKPNTGYGTTTSQNKIVLSLGKLLSSKGNDVAVNNGTTLQCAIAVEPPEDLHNINTNDLETLIETKKQEMNQLRAEESVLLERQRAYSTSNDQHVPKKGNNDIINCAKGVPVEIFCPR